MGQSAAVVLLALFGIGALSANAAIVDSVTASQQWPWSNDIKVKYVLSNVTDPTDLEVSALIDGKTKVIPERALKGARHGLTSEGEGELTIDPVVAFGTDQVALADLKIKVAAVASPANINEALYRIYDLTDGSCTDVTRKDLLNGKWGAVETSYRAIDPNFRTDAEDVLIWTDVTNNPAYKTTKLVMRRINARDRVWHSGDTDGFTKNNLGSSARAWIKLTYDYYVGVFEVTLEQYKLIYGSYPANCATGPEGSEYLVPANNAYYYNMIGYTMSDYASFNTVNCNEKLYYPNNTYVRDVGKESFCAKIWKKTGVELTFPTQAEWEFASRGGTDATLYSGESQTAANTEKLAWTASDGAKVHVVGLKKPNAYGLYDTLGNALERTLSRGAVKSGAISGSGDTEDDPAVNPIGAATTARDQVGLSYGGGSLSDAGQWMDCRSGACTGWTDYGNARKDCGFRLVCPVTKKWGADWPNTILDEEQEAAPVESVGTLYLGDERAAAAGAGKANAKVLAYDECTTGGLLANIRKGILEKVDPQTVELFIGLNNVLTKAYADETPLDTVIGVREIATALRKQYPNAMIWINPLAYDATDEAENIRRYAINKACVEINEGNSGRMFMRQPDWMYVYPGTNPWPTGGNSALSPYISKYWLANADDPRLKKKLAEKRAHTAGSYDCVMVGDSVTHFWENVNGRDYFAREIAPTWDVFNLGFGGDSTYHTIWNLLYSGLFDGYTTPLFTVLIGNNNISETSTDADLGNVAQACKRILDILKAKHPESRIVLFPLLPRGNAPGTLRTLSGKYNDLIREFADGTTVVWAGELWDAFLATADQDGNIPNNVFVDGVHPGTEGYRIWGEILKTYLPTKD